MPSLIKGRLPGEHDNMIYCTRLGRAPTRMWKQFESGRFPQRCRGKGLQPQQQVSYMLSYFAVGVKENKTAPSVRPQSTPTSAHVTCTHNWTTPDSRIKYPTSRHRAWGHSSKTENQWGMPGSPFSRCASSRRGHTVQPRPSWTDKSHQQWSATVVITGRYPRPIWSSCKPKDTPPPQVYSTSNSTKSSYSQQCQNPQEGRLLNGSRSASTMRHCHSW